MPQVRNVNSSSIFVRFLSANVLSLFLLEVFQKNQSLLVLVSFLASFEVSWNRGKDENILEAGDFAQNHLDQFFLRNFLSKTGTASDCEPQF